MSVNKSKKILSQTEEQIKIGAFISDIRESRKNDTVGIFQSSWYKPKRGGSDGKGGSEFQHGYA